MASNFGKLNFSVSFNPTAAFPLDARCYFESYEEAVKAAESAMPAGDSTTVYYHGQTIVVVENSVATLYIIQPDNTLSSVGGVVEINESVFSHDEDGKLSLNGFASAVEGAQLVKGSDGSLSWIKPDNTSVEGLQITITSMQESIETLASGMSDLSAEVSTIQSDLESSIAEVDAEIDALEQSVANKADSHDVYTKKETDSAIASAKSEVTAAILGEAGIDEKYDTLKEVADWILSDSTNSSELINRVSNIEKDYLNSTDKTELSDDIKSLSDLVGTLPSGAKSTTVLDYINESIENIDFSKYATSTDLASLTGRISKVESDTTSHATTLVDLVSRVGSAESKLSTIATGAQVNVIDTIDESQFKLENKHLTLLDIAMSKVTGLSQALAGKVDAIEGYTLLSPADKTKLDALVLGDNNSVQISGKVNAANVEGLEEWITGKAGVLVGLSSNNFSDALLEKLNAVEENAQVNKIETISVNGIALPISNKGVNLVIANTTTLGLVKSSDEENKVRVLDDGTMEVNTITFDRVVQSETDTIIMSGGSASI